MDELKMEGLELPDTGESYDDLPDASEGIGEAAPEDIRPSDSMDNFAGMDMPVLSEMDGSDIAAPAEQTSASQDNSVAPQPMFEDMSAPARQNNRQQDNFSQTAGGSGNTYQGSSASYRNTSGTRSSGSYQSAYGSSSSQSSMDALYEVRRAVDPEKYEKGRKKTRIVAGVGIGLYAYNTLSYLTSLFGGGGLSVILDLGVSGFLLYMFIRFFRGSNTAKETLAWWIGIDVVLNIIGLITAGLGAAVFSGIGMSGIFGILAVMGFITLIARGVMLYFLVLDDDISEYSKNKQ